MHAALLAAEESAEVANQMALSPVGFGVSAFVVLVAGLLVAYAFKSVGTRRP